MFIAPTRRVHDRSAAPLRWQLLWLATGMALALFLVWSLSAWRVSAAFTPDESTLVPVAPTRILDTRDPVDLGLAGPFVSGASQDLQVTGTITTADGTRVIVPEGATGVVLNVTVVGPTAAGFVSVRPAGMPGPPTTSSLNFEAGEITPNAVSVQVPTSGPHRGRIELTYDAFGVDGPTADLLVDVVAYTSSSGLADLAARVSALEAGSGTTGGQVGDVQSEIAELAAQVAALDAALTALDTSVAQLAAQLDDKQGACTDGSVVAYGFVPEDPGPVFAPLEGFSCTGAPLEVRRHATGEYRIRMSGHDLNTPAASIQVTPAGAGVGLVAGFQYSEVLGHQLRVLVRSTSGADSNASFHVVVNSAPEASVIEL